MDRSAFEQQARSWRKKALLVSKSCGAGKDEAEDIAQDVMLRLWQMHDELDRYEKPEALVTLMTRHLLRNHQRRRKPELLDEAMVARQTTAATAHDTAHLTISARGGAAKPRRDSPTVGH